MKKQSIKSIEIKLREVLEFIEASEIKTTTERQRKNNKRLKKRIKKYLGALEIERRSRLMRQYE